MLKYIDIFIKVLSGLLHTEHDNGWKIQQQNEAGC